MENLQQNGFINKRLENSTASITKSAKKNQNVEEQVNACNNEISPDDVLTDFGKFFLLVLLQ